jgi:hypothetical protein
VGIAKSAPVTPDSGITRMRSAELNVSPKEMGSEGLNRWRYQAMRRPSLED